MINIKYCMLCGTTQYPVKWSITLAAGYCINTFPAREKSMSLICMLNWGRTREKWTW